jgi:hypothetical protein
MDQIGQEIPDLQVDDIEDSILRCFRWVHRHVLFLRGERRPDSNRPGMTGTGRAVRHRVGNFWDAGVPPARAQACGVSAARSTALDEVTRKWGRHPACLTRRSRLVPAPLAGFPYLEHFKRLPGRPCRLHGIPCCRMEPTPDHRG